MWIAENLLRLMRAPRQDGHRCMVTTVCIGVAASAAADLLSSGDYAIAYSSSNILFHGTRRSEDELTVEKVKDVAASLDETNEYFAFKLANHMFRRFATQALLLAAYKTTPPSPWVKAVDVEPIALLSEIRKHVAPEHSALVAAALERMNRLIELKTYLASRDDSCAENGVLSKDSHLLKQLVDFKVAGLRNRKIEERVNEPELDESFFGSLQDDFNHLREFDAGSYFRAALELSREKGHYFLTAQEIATMNALYTKEQKDEFLERTATPKIMPLWYLVLALCRLLQRGEHVFSAHDAWWFGLIDEVPGAGLPNLREWRESRDAAPSQQPSSTPKI